MFGSQGPTFPDKVTVLVADATPMDCQLVSEAIQRHNHFRVIDRAVSSSETIAAVRKAQPDVAVISARLQDGAVRRPPGLAWIACSSQHDRALSWCLIGTNRELVVESFLNKARGLFCRIGSSGELRKCVQSVHNGEIWVNNSQLEYLVEALTLSPARAATNGKAATVLSKREEEVARLVATGCRIVTLPTNSG